LVGAHPKEEVTKQIQDILKIPADIHAQSHLRGISGRRTTCPHSIRGNPGSLAKILTKERKYMDDFIHFRKLITPSIIKVLFWISSILCCVSGIVLIASSFGPMAAERLPF
jgi:hypothetical protein